MISSNPHVDVTTVKGIPFFRMSAPFAGRRRSGELGRSVTLVGAPPLSTVAPVTSDVLWQDLTRSRQGGERSQPAPTKHGHSMKEA